MNFKTTAQTLVLTGTLGSLSSQANAQNCPYDSITKAAQAAGITDPAQSFTGITYRVDPTPEGKGNVSLIHNDFSDYLTSIEGNQRLIDMTHLIIAALPSLDPNRSKVPGSINQLTAAEIETSGVVNDGIKNEVLSLGAMLAVGKTCPTAAEAVVVGTPPSELNKFQKTLDDQRSYNKKSTRTVGCWSGGTGFLLGLLTLGLAQGMRAIIRKVRS